MAPRPAACLGMHHGEEAAGGGRPRLQREVRGRPACSEETVYTWPVAVLLALVTASWECRVCADFCSRVLQFRVPWCGCRRATGCGTGEGRDHVLAAADRVPPFPAFPPPVVAQRACPGRRHRQRVRSTGRPTLSWTPGWFYCVRGFIVVREGCKALGESSGITSHTLTRWVEGTVTQQRCGGSRDKSRVFSDTAGRWLGIVASPGSDVGLSLWLMVPCLFLCSSLTLCLGGANFRSAVATSALCRPFLEEAEMAAWPRGWGVQTAGSGSETHRVGTRHGPTAS